MFKPAYKCLIYLKFCSNHCKKVQITVQKSRSVKVVSEVFCPDYKCLTNVKTLLRRLKFVYKCSKGSNKVQINLEIFKMLKLSSKCLKPSKQFRRIK